MADHSTDTADYALQGLVHRPSSEAPEPVTEEEFRALLSAHGGWMRRVLDAEARLAELEKDAKTEWAVEYTASTPAGRRRRRSWEYGADEGGAFEAFASFRVDDVDPKLMRRTVYRSGWVHDPAKEEEIRRGQ